MLQRTDEKVVKIMFLFSPHKKKINKTFSENPASFILTSHDDLGKFKLQFVFCAGKANAKSYTLSRGPNCSLFLKADTDSHSEMSNLFNLSEVISLSTKYN